MKILVTGGAGFIGSNFIIYILKKYPSYEIVNLDALTYAGNLKNLKEVERNKNYRFLHGNILNKSDIEKSARECDVIINFAAESHVDNSIKNSSPFLQTNIIGTHNLLEYAKNNNIKKFIQISTDEVYGSINEGLFTENSQINPSSPYSASKAAADHMVKAYHETWKLNVNITRCSNNFGPRQHKEKFIPTCITKLFKNELIPIYGNGQNVRDWIYVDDHSRAIDLVLHKGISGEVYNIGGDCQMKNIDIASEILQCLGKKTKYLSFVEDRLGHDYRYAIDSTKIKTQLGWKLNKNFQSRLKDTIKWYEENYK